MVASPYAPCFFIIHKNDVYRVPFETVLIIAFISLDSSFYVLVNRFSFRNQFLFYGKKNVYYLRMQFLCIYR